MENKKAIYGLHEIDYNKVNGTGIVYRGDNRNDFMQLTRELIDSLSKEGTTSKLRKIESAVPG